MSPWHCGKALQYLTCDPSDGETYTVQQKAKTKNTFKERSWRLFRHLTTEWWEDMNRQKAKDILKTILKTCDHFWYLRTKTRNIKREPSEAQGTAFTILAMFSIFDRGKLVFKKKSNMFTFYSGKLMSALLCAQINWNCWVGTLRQSISIFRRLRGVWSNCLQ